MEYINIAKKTEVVYLHKAWSLIQRVRTSHIFALDWTINTSSLWGTKRTNASDLNAKSRFMFNVGEGTQRLCMEHGMRLSKTEHVFFTGLSSDTLGGVPGENMYVCVFS